MRGVGIAGVSSRPVPTLRNERSTGVQHVCVVFSIRLLCLQLQFKLEKGVCYESISSSVDPTRRCLFLLVYKSCVTQVYAVGDTPLQAIALLCSQAVHADI